MRKTILIIVSLSLCTLVFPNASALANSDITDAWLAFYPEACAELVSAAQSCILCHSSVPSLNPYGADSSAANNDFGSIEADDSDGDGRTNGEEILIDCTLPGDVLSPAEFFTWSHIKTLYGE